MEILLTLSLFILATNTIAFAMFGIDKGLAKQGFRRISEATLLGIAFIGGSVGAKFGQLVFRHKTRKEPFRTQLNVIIAVQIAALVALAVPTTREMIFAALNAL